MTQYLSDRDLANRYGVSRATIWRWMQRGRLPPPRKIAENTTRWRLDEVEAADEAQERGAAAG